MARGRSRNTQSRLQPGRGRDGVTQGVGPGSKGKSCSVLSLARPESEKTEAFKREDAHI